MNKKIRLLGNIFLKSDSPESLKNTVIKLISGFIVIFVHPDSWYKASFKVYSLTNYLQYFNLNKLSSNARDAFQVKRVFILNQLLSLLTRTGIPFYIPYEFNSKEINMEDGTLLCSSHLPLIKVCIKAMIENNSPIDAIIAKHPTKEYKVSIWGMAEGVPALKSDNNVLLKTKSLLSKNAKIGLMVDDTETSDYSPNSMKICTLTGSKVVFCFAQLKKNGTISTWLEKAPYPYCKTEFEIQENVDGLRSRTNQIFQEYLN